MDRNEIVKSFMSAGYQLGMDALQYFEANPEAVREFLALAPGKLEKPFVGRQDVDRIFSSMSPKVRVIGSYLRKKRDLGTGEMADMFAKRYEKASEILSKKSELVNLLSINRIRPENKAFSIIAMVREVSPGDRSLVVEDPTGSTTVFISDALEGEFGYLVEDEVVGIVCDNEDFSENRAIKIVYPDIPLQVRAPAADKDVTCMFISDIHMDDGAFMRYNFEKLGEYLKKIKEDTVVFVLGDISSREEDTEEFLKIFPENIKVMVLRGHLDEEKGAQLPDPVMVEVSGVKILMSHGSMFQRYKEKFKASAENTLLQMLKKRHLSPTFDQTSNLDDEKMFLSQVPDIAVVGHFHEPSSMNYKGTTIISLGSFVGNPVFWSVNLRTREAKKIDFN